MIFPADFELKLGFDQIRQRIKNYCLSLLGAKQVDDLAFGADFELLSVLLKRTLEFRQILEKGDAFPLTGYFDPTELFHIASIEDSFIEEEGFRNIILSLHTIQRCKQFLSTTQEIYPELWKLSEQTAFSKSLLNTLESKFDDLGHVKDNATPDLSKIRKRLREEQGRIRRLTDHIFRQSVEQGWVPEGASPTIRDGRLVIPVMAEHKRKVKATSWMNRLRGRRCTWSQPKYWRRIMKFVICFLPNAGK